MWLDEFPSLYQQNPICWGGCPIQRLHCSLSGSRWALYGGLSPHRREPACDLSTVPGTGWVLGRTQRTTSQQESSRLCCRSSFFFSVIDFEAEENGRPDHWDGGKDSFMHLMERTQRGKRHCLHTKMSLSGAANPSAGRGQWITWAAKGAPWTGPAGAVQLACPSRKLPPSGKGGLVARSSRFL